MTKKLCVDCGVKRREAKYPGPRCFTCHKAKSKDRKDTAWANHIEKTYGITADEYWRIYEYQGGKCYICQRGTGKGRKLAVDHDHKTGEVRGLLDRTCNRYILGNLRDDLDAAQRVIDYLTDPPARHVLNRT